MNILANKESMAALARCAKQNIDFLPIAISIHISDDELSAAMEGKLQEILYYLRQVYNSELVELKQKSCIYYQRRLALKNTEKSTADVVYPEYLQLKRKIDQIKIDQMEIPF